MARFLKDVLTLRIAGIAAFNKVEILKDANSWPIVKISMNGVETAGAACIKARIEAVAQSSADVFGNASKAYGPHLMTILSETDAVEAADYAIVLHELLAQETQAVLRMTAAATAIVDARLEDAPIVGSVGDLMWPTKES